LTPFDLYKEYIALKSHFNSDYDYFKYNGAVSATKDALTKRNDAAFFYVLAKKRHPKELLLSNFVERNDFSPADFALKKTDETYYDWVKRVKSITYVFKKELDALLEDFDNNFKVKDGQTPYLLKLYYNKEVSIETIAILLDLTKSQSYWDKTVIDPMWPMISNKIKKYIPFIRYKKEEIRSIVKEKFKGA